MPIDEDLGLSEREKELKKWNAPYRFQAFPRMLYRGVTVRGKLEVEQRLVANELEQATAEANGWETHPTPAIDAETARQEAPGIAAAERAYRDLSLSQLAQAEAQAAEAATSRHLGEIPVRPTRVRPSRATRVP